MTGTRDEHAGRKGGQCRFFSVELGLLIVRGLSIGEFLGTDTLSSCVASQ